MASAWPGPPPSPSDLTPEPRPVKFDLTEPTQKERHVPLREGQASVLLVGLRNRSAHAIEFKVGRSKDTASCRYLLSMNSGTVGAGATVIITLQVLAMQPLPIDLQPATFKIDWAAGESRLKSTLMIVHVAPRPNLPQPPEAGTSPARPLPNPNHHPKLPELRCSWAANLEFPLEWDGTDLAY